jgi:hypothetical protein
MTNPTSGSYAGTALQYAAATGSSYYSNFYYNIPASLKNVTVTMDTTLPLAAFNNCDKIENITINNSTSTIGNDVFRNCSSLKRLNSESDGTFNIPATVVGISDYAFNNCSLAETITLSEDVTSIGKYAFSGCSLTSKFNSFNSIELIVPESCSSIGEFSFEGMALMTNLIVPDSVETIGNGAFKGFNSLESITLPFVGKNDGAVGYEAVFGYIFGYAETSGSYGSYRDPSGYVQMTNPTSGSYAGTALQYAAATGSSYYSNFYYNIPASLKNVTVTMDTTLPLAAFNNCDKIENITINNSTSTIGNDVFRNCSSLKRLNSESDGTFNIPATVVGISDYAFNNCSLAETITLSEDVTSIGKYAFSGCSLTSKFNSFNSIELIVPESCSSIGEFSFEGMALMTNLIVPDSVETIGNGAFKGFNSLESITLPFVGKNDGAVGYEAVFGYIFGYAETSGSYGSYRDPSGYVQMTNPTSGSYAGTALQYAAATGSSYYSNFYYNIPASLKNVTVTMDTTLPLAAFNNCDKIENIHLVNCVDSVGTDAFRNCNANVDYLIAPSKSGAWDGVSIETNYHGGAGSQQDPYQIFSAKEFVYFLNQIRDGENYDGVYFVLTSNINLGAFAVNATALTEETAFKGVLDGNSHKIFNFTVTASDNSYNGLFGYVDGTIKNIGFETSMTITTSKKTDVYVGLIIGNLNGALENVYVTGILTSTSLRTSYIGGLVGYNNGSISNSYANVNVTATSTNLKCYAAGLVGCNDGSITGSFAHGNVSAKGYAESYSYASGLVAAEGTNSVVTSCFRYSGQTITKFVSASTSYNNVGTEASLEDIISYCRLNWNGSVWSYKKALPSF